MFCLACSSFVLLVAASGHTGWVSFWFFLSATASTGKYFPHSMEDCFPHFGDLPPDSQVGCFFLLAATTGCTSWWLFCFLLEAARGCTCWLLFFIACSHNKPPRLIVVCLLSFSYFCHKNKTLSYMIILATWVLFGRTLYIKLLLYASACDVAFRHLHQFMLRYMWFCVEWWGPMWASTPLAYHD